MVVSEGAINNIMGGMENTAGVRLHSHRHKLKQRFDIIRKLGQGTYGKVQLAVNKETGQEVAIKTIKKAKIETEQDLIRIRREIQIMSSVQHPQIIHIYEVFENREKMVLVMEYAAGGELYDYLSDRKVLTEDEARRIFRHVASATYYCHKHKICHRDLKLENILLDLDGNAKIADFGLSNVFDEKHRLDTFCGSPLYASPEIVKGIPYTGPEVDCWSLGVLLYTLVYGAMPFDGSNFKRLVKQITQGDYYEPKKPSRASDLIRQMLTVSATKRATIEDICSHWWVNEGFLEPCLEVAEALANQTPVRLDLLLSLAPKHINSEHMLIQPEEDDSARSPPSSESARPPPQLLLPPPPPPDSAPTARSASLGSLATVNRTEIDALLARKAQERKEEEKKRKANESGVIEKKKKRESTSEGAAARSGSSRKERKEALGGDSSSATGRPPAAPEGESELLRKKGANKKDGDAERRRGGAKKREPEADGQPTGDKAERRKGVKKRETSADKGTEKRRTAKRRESSREDDKPERRKTTTKKEEEKGTKDDGGVLPVINGQSRDMGEDRNSNMDVLEDREPTLAGESSAETVGSSGQVGDRPEPMEIERAGLGTSQSFSTASDATLKASDSSLQDAQEGAEAETPKGPEARDPETSRVPRTDEAEEANSAHSAIPSAETSRPSCAEKRQSKISKAAALWETQGAPPPQPEKNKKPVRSVGNNALSDRAKKFEEVPVAERKVVPSFKVSDARKNFESKPAEKPKVGLRKKSATESLPSSPTRQEGPKLPTTHSGPISSRDAREGTPVKETSSKDKSPLKEMPAEKEGEEDAREKSPKMEESSEEGTELSPRPSLTQSSIDATEEKEEELDEVVSAVVEEPEAVVKPPTEADRHEALTSSEEEGGTAVVVGGLNLKLGGVGKISEVGTKQEVLRAEASDSSDSESEAEKLLKMVSEKREKVEAARQEKLRRVSEAKDRDLKKDVPAIREEEPRSKSPSRSPEEALGPSPSAARESPPEQKFATLPRGFKAKAPRAGVVAAPSSPPLAERPRKDDRKDKAISQEIEGMMSAIRAVDEAITKEEQEIKILRDSLAQSLPESKEAGLPEGSASPHPERDVEEEVRAVPAEQGPGETSQKPQEAQVADRKKTQLEIVLDNKKSDIQEPDPANKRASYAEIKLTSPTTKDAPKTQEYKSEVRHNVGPVHGMGEAQLQRVKRERIIPIMLEDDDEEEETTSEGLPHNDRAVHVDTSSSAGSRVTSPLPSQLPHRRTSDPRSPMYKPSPEPIRKSPRERIIPIAVEGEGIVTPPTHAEGAAELGAARAHQAFSRTLSGRPSSLNRGRGFLLDRSESFSSAGEEEEEDEDDGFQILTAESLFSTLLNRVRSLTRKMNADDVRGERSRRSSNRPTPEPGTAPNSAGIGPPHSASSGFWSSLYNSPRDSPARRISETMSRSSLGRDDDTLGGLTSPLWTRSISRDTSDADTLFSEASTPFGTLPRGWRTSRWSGAEDGGESDASDASVRSLTRRPQYSRAPSRELHNIPDEELGSLGGAGYPSSSLPRPYPARGTHEADRIAAAYGTLRARRPRSAQPSGEHPGRDGGLFEQPRSAAQIGVPQGGQRDGGEEEGEAPRQSVHEQLQRLVRELEGGAESVPEEQRNDVSRYDQLSHSISSSTPLQHSTKPMYSSNPALHTSTPNTDSTLHSGYRPTPKMSRGRKEDARRSLGKDNNMAYETATRSLGKDTNANMAYETGTRSLGKDNNMTNETPTELNSNLPTFTSNVPVINDKSVCDQNAVPGEQIGDPLKDLDRVTSPSNNDASSQRLMSNKVIRSADRYALDAYRRSKGRGDMLEYQRGKSDDLCHALNSLSRMESQHKGTLTTQLPDNNAKVMSSKKSDPTAGHVATSPSNNYNKVNDSDKRNGSVVNSDLTNTIPRVTNGGTNDKNSIATSRSTSGIPLRTSSRGSYGGVANSNLYAKGNNEVPKTYQRNKSRELTPAIEAASEKFAQLNSGTLKRISPFEAYRRTRTSELPMEAANRESMRFKSPPPERAKSPFEKAKTTIEKKVEDAKSPLQERAMSPPATNDEKMGIKSNKHEDENHKNHEMDDEKMHKCDKERGKVKKTSSCDPDKPKSMYKLLASRFNRSGSNVSENNKKQDEDEEKFRLKRPSRFLKHRTEKSSSKSSICDGENQDDSDRSEKKPSKKLTDALNKFLGRNTKEYSRSSMSQPSVPSIGVEEQPKKPPRGKKFSKSQENLSLNHAQEEVVQSPTAEMAPSAAPNNMATNLQPSYTLESVTKSICDHLSQLESDITSRIGNIGVQESAMRPKGSQAVQESGIPKGSQVAPETGMRPKGSGVVQESLMRPKGSEGVQETGMRPKGSHAVPKSPTVSPITNYGLSPALANRRSARPTNLDLANANYKPATQTNDTSTNDIPKTDKVKYAQIKRLDHPGELDASDGGPVHAEGLSENENESVIDRITRKSYYSKFQNKKKPQQLRKANTKEDVDQQLAAAKARLMKEDTQRAVRESLSPLRYSSVSPKGQNWEIPRRHSRKSLPPDPKSLFLRRGTSLQPDDVARLASVQDVRRLPESYGHRAPSVPPLDYRMRSVPPEERRDPPPLDDFSSNYSNSIPDSRTTPKSPNGQLGQEAVSAVAAAGALAGEAAAVATAEGAAHQRGSSCEPSANPVGQDCSDDTRNLAREELSRRLTHLTRISGWRAGSAGGVAEKRPYRRTNTTGQLADPSANQGPGEKLVYRRTNTTGQLGDPSANQGPGERPVYRRTNTTGQLGDPSTNQGQGEKLVYRHANTIGQMGDQPANQGEKLVYRRTSTAGQMGDQPANQGLGGERPVYRRTNTMDLPPSEARGRPGSEFRRQLQDPARRYSAARPLVEGEVLNTSSPRLPSTHTPLSTSSSYHRGYSTMDPPRYTSTVDPPRYTSTVDPPRYTSTLSSTVSPLPRRTSFYRY